MQNARGDHMHRMKRCDVQKHHEGIRRLLEFREVSSGQKALKSPNLCSTTVPLTHHG